MEGGQFSGERSPARPGPSFEPPADPGAGGPSVHGLSARRADHARARARRGGRRDPAAGLRRRCSTCSGRRAVRCTTSALSRWTDVLEAALAGEEQAALAPFRSVEEAAARHPPAVLLDAPPSRAGRRSSSAHVAVAVALDDADRAAFGCVVQRATAGPPARRRSPCTAHAGGRAGTQAELAAGDAGHAQPRLRRRVRPGRPSRPGECADRHRRGRAADRARRCAFAAPRAIQTGDARLVAFAELV